MATIHYINNPLKHFKAAAIFLGDFRFNSFDFEHLD
jgi:hypothetical protein